MSFSNLTDEQIYVVYATEFANIDVRLQDLLNAAAGTNPPLAPGIIADWQTANINSGRARLRLFVNQGAAVDQLIQDFLTADESMAAALQNLQGLPAQIGNVANLINAAVTAGSTLIGGAPIRP
jgi:hypothetical protein